MDARVLDVAIGEYGPEQLLDGLLSVEADHQAATSVQTAWCSSWRIRSPPTPNSRPGRPRRSPGDLAHPERIALLAPIIAAAIDRHPLDDDPEQQR